MRPTFLVSITVILMLAAGTRAAPPLEEWRSGEGRDHPLAGTVYDVAADRMVKPARVAEAAAGARYVLLGETHTNPDHHRLQAWTIRALARRGRTPTVVWEMLGPAKADTLSRFAAKPDSDAAALGDALGWADTGWPDWALYQPIAAAALAHDLPMRPGGPKREHRKAVVHAGFGALPGELRATLGLDQPLPDAAESALRDLLANAHCGEMPDSAVTAMLRVQRLRDAAMARAMRRGAQPAGEAVLIAGTGHARRDWGVPHYLDGDAVVIAFREVRRSDPAASAYVPETTVAEPAVDYLWFTPRAPVDTPACGDSTGS